MKRLRNSTVIIFVIVFVVFVLTRCIDKNNQQQKTKTTVSKTYQYTDFAGSGTCANCHKKIYDTHIHTAHYFTSRPANEKYVKGSFKKGRNIYPYNPDLLVAMEKRDSGLYQVVYYKQQEIKALPFDIVIGSGARGQSYSYWQNNSLFQLPVSYFTFAERWVNSPGFPSKVQIDRPITSRCLECHSSFIDKISAPEVVPEEFDHTRIILGVDCEKCHGPGARHAEFQLQNPDETAGKFIINPSRFSRQQKLDMCALCHGGSMKKIKPSFSFIAGDSLSDYFTMDSLTSTSVNSGTVDVHGNKYGLLKASKCFLISETMTCNTCHNVHEKETGKLALFSQRCMNCHNKEHGNFCTIKPATISSLSNNCIDCHMPAKPSQAIVLFSGENEIPKAAIFRSHFISIYRDEAKKVIEDIQSNK